MNSHIPSDVKDAIRKLSEFTNQNGYAEATVSYTGSASFTQHSNRKKKDDFGVIGCTPSRELIIPTFSTTLHGKTFSWHSLP